MPAALIEPEPEIIGERSHAALKKQVKKLARKNGRAEMHPAAQDEATAAAKPVDKKEKREPPLAAQKVADAGKPADEEKETGEKPLAAYARRL